MNKPSQRSDSEYEYLTKRNAEIAHTLRSGIGNLSRYGMYLAAVWIIAKYSYLAIDSLSGDHTSADIIVKVIGALDISIWMSLTVSGSTIYLWNREKTLRKRLERRNSQLERDWQKANDEIKELKKKQLDGIGMVPKD